MNLYPNWPHLSVDILFRLWTNRALSENKNKFVCAFTIANHPHGRLHTINRNFGTAGTKKIAISL